MGGAIEAPEKQASPHSYSFYYHSLVTRHNNTGYSISINFTGGDIHLSIFKLHLLTMLTFMGCPQLCCECSYLHTFVCVYICPNLAVDTFLSVVMH